MVSLPLTPQTKKRNPKGRIWTHPVICDGKLYLRDQEYIPVMILKISPRKLF